MKRLGFVVRTMIGVTNRVPIRMQHVLTVLKEVVVCRDSLLCPRPVHIQEATFVQHTVRLGVARESQYHRLHLWNPETRESRPTRDKFKRISNKRCPQAIHKALFFISHRRQACNSYSAPIILPQSVSGSNGSCSKMNKRQSSRKRQTGDGEGIRGKDEPEIDIDI